MAVAVNVPKNVLDAFNDMKIRKKYRYMLVKVAGDGSVTHTAGKREATPAEFKKAFKKDECVFAIYDHPTSNKLLLIHWNPDTANVKSKMTSASAAKGVLESFSGVGSMLQASTEAEVTELIQ